MSKETIDLSYYEASHVIDTDGNVYAIYQLSGDLGKFLLISEDDESTKTLTKEELVDNNFQPVDHVHTTKMDSDGMPEDLVDLMTQMRYETENLLDWQAEEFPRKKK